MRGAWRWFAAAGTGALAGLALWWWIVSLGNVDGPHTSSKGPGVALAGGTADRADGIAIGYARAFQQSAWDDIIEWTWWMQERLERVQLESSDPAALARARVQLRARLRKRVVEGNQLRPEGIEDQYIFAPGALLEVVSVDAGRQDLVKPVRQRTWIGVTYPTRSCAPRDEAGNPLRTITVGVNVSTDGFVLKANVIGNLDICQGSTGYIWPGKAEMN